MISMKVVFHIDELEKWSETGKNVKNLIKASPETTIVVSVNGIAITGYLDSANAEFLDCKESFFTLAPMLCVLIIFQKVLYLNK